MMENNNPPEFDERQDIRWQQRHYNFNYALNL